MSNIPTSIGEFDKSLQALLHYGDCFKRREKQLKQQYNTKLNKQKNEFNVQLEKEKERIEQLQDKNRALIDQIEEMTEKQINFTGKYSILNTNFNNNQIEETKPSNVILENQKLKILLTERDNEILQLNKQLNEASKQIEERLLQLITKVKTEFEIMYTKQSTSFLKKIDLLKEEQYLLINKQ